MAFIKEYDPGNTGASASYWRLTHFAIDRIAGVIDVIMHSYFNEQARQDGKSPMGNMRFTLPIESDTLSVGDLYERIKSLTTPATDPEEPPVPGFFADAVSDHAPPEEPQAEMAASDPEPMLPPDAAGVTPDPVPAGARMQTA